MLLTDNGQHKHHMILNNEQSPHIFGKCTQNITRIVISFTYINITSYTKHIVTLTFPILFMHNNYTLLCDTHIQYSASGTNLINTSTVQEGQDTDEMFDTEMYMYHAYFFGKIILHTIFVPFFFIPNASKLLTPV